MAPRPDAITAVGIEPFRIVCGTPSTARNCVDTKGLETLAGKTAEVTVPTIGASRDEGSYGKGVVGDEGGPNLGADDEGLGADGRTEPGEQAPRRATHGRDRGLENAGCEPAPTCMGGRNDGASRVTEKHGQAVGRQYDADTAGPVRPGSIGTGTGSIRAAFDDGRAVNLFEPARLGRQQ